MARSLQPRFVGRQLELRRVWQAMAAARLGQGSVVLVTGEAGVGKTRLCTEVLSRQRRSTTVLLEGRAVRGEEQPALANVVDSLRNAGFGLADRLWPALRARAPRLSAVLPELGPSAGAQGADDPLVYQGLLDSVAEAAGEELVVWLLDDMQHADVATWRFLCHASRHLVRRKVLVLAVTCDDEVDLAERLPVPLSAMRHALGAVEIHVNRLSRADTEDLVRSAAGRGLPAETLARVVDRSAGNARTAIELVGAALAGEVDALPPSIRNTVELRISGLSTGATALLEMLAVMAPDPGVGLVLTLREDSDDLLAELTDAGLVELAVDRQRSVVRFRHPLYREAAQARTSWARRRLLHSEIADALEGADGGRDLSAVMSTANHRELGGDAERAVASLSATARALRAAGQVRAAGDLFLAALQVMERNPGLAERRAGIELEAMHELSAAGRWVELLPLAWRAWHNPAMVRADGDGRLAASLGVSLLMTGRVDEANTLLATEASRLQHSGRAREAPSLLAAAAAAALNAGHLSRSRHLCETALRSPARGTSHLVGCLAIVGEFRKRRDREAASEAFRMAYESAHREGVARVAAVALWNHARMTTRMRDAERAEALGDRTYPLVGGLSRLLTGTIHLLEGRHDRAAAALGQGGTEVRDAAPFLAPLADALLAHLDLHLGNVDRARARLERWQAERAEVCSVSRALVLGAEGWLAWESGALGRAAERWQECAEECASSGYGLFESPWLLLPLHVDALVRLGRGAEAERTVQVAEASADRDRFFRASLAAARFRLAPSAESGAAAREAAASAPWPLLQAQVRCWCAEHLGDRSAGEAALRLFSAIGASRRADRASQVLAMPPAAERAQIEEASVLRLSRREREVAALVAEGFSNGDIAARLGLGVATVTTHVKHILGKLGFRSRAQVAAWISEQRMRSWENDVLLRRGRRAVTNRL